MRHLIEALNAAARAAVAPVFFLAAWSIGFAIQWEPEDVAGRSEALAREFVTSSPVRWWELDPNGRDEVAERAEFNRRRLVVEAFPIMTPVFLIEVR